MDSGLKFGELSFELNFDQSSYRKLFQASNLEETTIKYDAKLMRNVRGYDDKFIYYSYKKKPREFKNRLDLLGFTLEKCEKQFNDLRAWCVEYWDDGNSSNYLSYDEYFDLINKLDFRNIANSTNAQFFLKASFFK